MAKQQWKSKSFSNHIDPDKEEQLKRVKIVVDDQVKHILNITNEINHGNKERNLRKKSEAIELIEDFHMQYEKLYILYENLREKVKKTVDGEDDSSSTPDSDAESNYWNGGNDQVNNGSSRISDRGSQESETSDIEDTYTCSSAVTKIMNSEPGSPFSRSSGLGDIIRDLEIQREKAGKTNQILVDIRELEAQLAALRIEVSTLQTHKRLLEEQVEWKSNEAVQTQDKISRLEAQIMEMEATSKEQERFFSSSRKQFEDDKQLHTSRITELEAQAEGMQLELNSLKHQKTELEVELFDEAKQWSSKVDGLMEQVSSMQQQLETVNSYKAELKLKIEKKSEEISEYLLQIEALRNELSLSEQRTAEEKESLQVKVHDLEAEIELFSSIKSNLEEQVKQINHEASQSSLETEKLEEKVSELQRAIAKREELSLSEQQTAEEKESLQVKVHNLESEIESLSRSKSHLEEQVKQINHEASQSSLEREKLEEKVSELQRAIAKRENELSLSEQQTVQEKESLQVKIHELESEIESLSSSKCDLEEQVKKINHEASQSSLEREMLEEKVSELQRAIADRENELSTEQNKFKESQTMMSEKMKSLEKGVESLTSKLETSENERNHLQVELEASQNRMKLLKLELNKEKEHNKSQLEKITKTNFHHVERKIEEMAVEFRKQFEDQYRILSRRIRVAEQLQAENKEWYRKTRDLYEQDNRDLKRMTAKTATELKNVKDLTITANNLLTMIDSKALKFEKCTANFENKISKASRKINSAKLWAMRKKKAMSHMKDDLDCLLVQLDEKEAEILASREKVCKLENKVRELEKKIEEKEDEMLVLTEEKMEAIRQLCIWIDYHKGRKDFYKNLLSGKNTGRRRAL